MKAEKQKRL